MFVYILRSIRNLTFRGDKNEKILKKKKRLKFLGQVLRY
jgi:hypothetical protein